jgi:hypothetical protein
VVLVRLQVLTAASMKMRAFCDIAPCSLVGVHTAPITLMMEAVRTSKTSVYSNETTRRNVPESSHLHSICLFYVCATCLILDLIAVTNRRRDLVMYE